MEKNSRIFVAGHKGLVGSSILRYLNLKGFNNLITSDRSKLDLTEQSSVFSFFKENLIEYVFLCAAKVGGILANKERSGDFILENLKIQTNVIEASFRQNVKKLLFLGSSCIYPKLSTQPITEDQLLTGPLEPTNEAYAIAKIAGIKLCQNLRKQYGFDCISLMPTNLYGINDNFDLNNSHVLPALISKIHDAKEKNKKQVECWGDGSPKREFLYVDDLASACFHCMNNYSSDEIINIGTGEDISIKDLTYVISDIIGFKGDFVWDTSKPNGTPRKVLNVDKIKSLGWTPQTSLKDGIEKTYKWYKKNL